MLSTKQVADRLGLKRYQLTFLIDTNQIKDSENRISGRRVFTESEFEAIKLAIETKKRGN